MKTTNVYPKIEGIVLNDAVVARLHSYQADNSEPLKYDIESIANAICFIATMNENIRDCDKIEAFDIIEKLSYVRMNLKGLADDELNILY